jgi:hypothetical protein
MWKINSLGEIFKFKHQTPHTLHVCLPLEFWTQQIYTSLKTICKDHPSIHISSCTNPSIPLFKIFQPTHTFGPKRKRKDEEASIASAILNNNLNYLKTLKISTFNSIECYNYAGENGNSSAIVFAACFGSPEVFQWFINLGENYQDRFLTLGSRKLQGIGRSLLLLGRLDNLKLWVKSTGIGNTKYFSGRYGFKPP